MPVLPEQTDYAPFGANDTGHSEQLDQSYLLLTGITQSERTPST